MLIETAQEHRSGIRARGRMVLAAVLAGLAAGAGGITLTLVLHAVQHWAFGYTEASFLTGVERAAPSRRVVAMAIGGLVVGVGWWALRRWCTPVPSVTKALSNSNQELPIGVLTADAVWPIVAVGAGTSLGRQGPPASSQPLPPIWWALVLAFPGRSGAPSWPVVPGRDWPRSTTSHSGVRCSPWRSCWPPPPSPM